VPWSHNGETSYLSSYATSHDSTPKYEGINQLMHSEVGKDWKLQIQVTSSLMELHGDNKQNQGFAVSDGSFQEKVGAAAWIIEGSTGHSQIIGTMITPGSPEDHSSF